MRRFIRRQIQRLKHNKSAIKTLVLLVVFGSLPFWFLLCNFMLKFITAITVDQIPVWHKPIVGNTSIAFYIATKAIDETTPDLRTRFWEEQLKEFTGDYDRIYVSDQYNIVNGYELLTFDEKDNNTSIYSQCRLFHGSIHSFTKTKQKFKWLFYTSYKTYVNLTNLAEVIRKYEDKYDPMSQKVVNVGSYDKKIPFIESGILMSNFAVQKALSPELDEENYNLCENGNQNYYFQSVINNLTTHWYSDRFGLNWPSGSNDIIKKKEYFKLQKCPKKIAPMYSYIGISLSNEAIKESKKMLKKYQSNLAIMHEDHKDTFCKIVPVIK